MDCCNPLTADYIVDLVSITAQPPTWQENECDTMLVIPDDQGVPTITNHPYWLAISLILEARYPDYCHNMAELIDGNSVNPIEFEFDGSDSNGVPITGTIELTGKYVGYGFNGNPFIAFAVLQAQIKGDLTVFTFDDPTATFNAKP